MVAFLPLLREVYCTYVLSEVFEMDFVALAEAALAVAECLHTQEKDLGGMTVAKLKHVAGSQGVSLLKKRSKGAILNQMLFTFCAFLSWTLTNMLQLFCDHQSQSLQFVRRVCCKR